MMSPYKYCIPPECDSVDKPTPDNYTCTDQKEFDKCYFPFMTSALAAQWQVSENFNCQLCNLG